MRMERMPQGIIVKDVKVRERVGCTEERECTPKPRPAVKRFVGGPLRLLFLAAQTRVGHGHELLGLEEALAPGPVEGLRGLGRLNLRE